MAIDVSRFHLINEGKIIIMKLFNRSMNRFVKAYKFNSRSWCEFFMISFSFIAANIHGGNN